MGKKRYHPKNMPWSSWMEEMRYKYTGDGPHIWISQLYRNNRHGLICSRTVFYGKVERGVPNIYRVGAAILDAAADCNGYVWIDGVGGRSQLGNSIAYTFTWSYWRDYVR